MTFKDFIAFTNNNQGYIMVLLTFVYVIATLGLVWLSHRQIQVATNLERNRTRPFAVFDLIVNRHFVFANIKNTGQTSAHDVQIKVSPNIQCLLGGENVYPSEERSVEIAFLTHGIAMLAPQGEITAMMGPWERVKSTYPDLRFKGTISYCSADGVSYSEPFIADLSAHEGIIRLAEKDIQDVANHLEAISRNLDHLITGFKNPLIRTISEQKYQEQQSASFEEAIQGLSQKANQQSNPKRDERIRIS